MDLAQVSSSTRGTRAGQAAGRVARRWHRTAWLLAWLTFLPIAVLRAGLLSEGDTFWQVRTGLVIIRTHAIPMVDPFSWTMHGRPWTQNSWGFDLFAGVAYRLAGLTGVAWACAALVMGAVGLVLVAARRLGATPVTAGAALLLASPLLVGWLSARPQLADYLAVLVLVLLLRRIAAGAGGAWDVLGVGVLSVVWVNAHAGSLLGVAMTGACTVLLLARPATRRQGWVCAAATAAALAGSFVNPYGTGVIAQTQDVQASSAGLLVEWQHFNPASPTQWLAMALGVAALAVSVRRGESPFTAALAVLTAAGLYALRFQPVLVLVSLPVLAAAVPQAPGMVRRYLHSRRTMFARCGVLGLVAWAAVAAPSLTHIGEPNPADYPASIVADIPHGCHVFDSYLLGSYLILERPDTRVSLDSRNTLYGQARILADGRVLEGHGNLTRELAGAGCVLAPPWAGLVARLRTDPAWTLRASDQAAVLFVRDQAANSGPRRVTERGPAA